MPLARLFVLLACAATYGLGHAHAGGPSNAFTAHAGLQTTFHGAVTQGIAMPRPVLLNPTGNASGTSRPTLSAPLLELMQKLTDSASEIEKSWPGYKIFDQPILINRPGQAAILIGAAQAPSSFQSYQSAQSQIPIFVLPGGIQNTTKMDGYDLGNQSAFLYRFDPGDDVADTFETVVHEHFHNTQHAGWQKTSQGQTYPILDPVNWALAQMEQKALAQALTAAATKNRLEHIKEFVALRRARYETLESESQRIEAWQEREEGTARFIELEAARISTNKSQQQRLASSLQESITPSKLRKFRYYHTGAAQCFLLEALGSSDWRKNIETGSPAWELLQNNVTITDDERQKIFTEAKQRFHYDAALAEATKLINTYKKRRHAVLQEWDQAPGFKLTFITGKISGFDFHKSEIFEESQEKWLVKGENCEIAGSGYKLTAKKRPFFWHQNIDIKTNIVANGTIQLDGSSHLLTEGIFSFQNLLIDENGLNIEITRPGTIEVQDQKITIRFK